MQQIDHEKKARDLNAIYESLDVDHGDGDGGRFLFGWQTENPFAQKVIDATELFRSKINYSQYSYVDQDKDLNKKIVDTHARLDGYAPDAVFCVAGSTAALFAFTAYLAKTNVRRVYYLPPLYFTQHVALSMFGIDAIPVSELHAIEPDYSFALPSQTSVLLLADPVWYAGMSVTSSIIGEISAWQLRTNSLVFVDGSFQYMHWSKRVAEATATLNPQHTVRLISPTKSLAIHGYRFAYFLLPAAVEPKLAWTYNHIYGSCSADTIAFGHAAVEAVNVRTVTNKLTDFISNRHRALREHGVIDSPLTPHCGYFAFENVRVPLPENYFRLEGKYFDQPRYPGHAKVNLLSPSIKLILPAEVAANELAVISRNAE